MLHIVITRPEHGPEFSFRSWYPNWVFFASSTPNCLHVFQVGATNLVMEFLKQHWENLECGEGCS